MTKETVLRAVGNSVGATFPKPMLDRLNVEEGDRVYLVEVENGVLLTPYDPAFAEEMAAFREGMQKYRNAMRELSSK